MTHIPDTSKIFKIQDCAQVIGETIKEPLLILDQSLNIKTANTAFLKTFKYKKEEILEKNIFKLDGEDWDIPQFKKLLQKVNEKSVDVEIEHVFKKAGYKSLVASAKKAPLEYQKQNIIILAIEDITDRKIAEKKYKNQLEYVASLSNHVSDAVITTDMNLNIKGWNRAAEELYKWRGREVIGRKLMDVIPVKNISRDRKEILSKVEEKGEWKGKMIQVNKKGEEVYTLSSVSHVKNDEGENIGYIAVIKDISEIENTENYLKQRISQQKAVAQLGQEVISRKSIEDLMNKALKTLKDNLEIDYAKVLKLLPDEKYLVLKAGIGWSEKVKIEKSTVDTGKNSQAGYTLLKDKPVIVKELSKDKRFTGPPLLKNHNVVSGMSVIINGRGKPYGVLGVHTKKKTNFNKNDINFLQSVANIVSQAIIEEEDKGQLRKYQERLNSAQAAGGIGVFEWNMKTGDLWWSDVEKKLFGLSDHEYKGKISDWENAVHLEDFTQVKEDINQAITHKDKNIDLEFRVVHPNRSVKWLKGKGQIVYNSKGLPLRMVGANYDITERKNIEDGLQYKAHASRILSSSLNYRMTLRSLAQLAVPKIADWCVIDLFNEKEELEQIELIHTDNKKVKWAKKMREKYTPDLKSSEGIAKVLKTGRPAHIPRVTDKTLKKMAHTKEHYSMLKKVGLTSIMIVPLKVLYKTIGAITFVSAESKKSYTEIDLNFAEQIASRAAMAIENAKLYETVEDERKRLNDILATTPGIVWEAEVDKNYNINKVNYISEYAEEMLGYDATQITSGVDFWEKVIVEDDRKRVREEIKKIVKNKKSGVIRMRMTRSDGRVIWGETTCQVIGEDKKVKSVRCITVDITESVEAEERKDEFISLASHELKTPLTSLHVYSHLLNKKMTAQKDEEATQTLRKIERQINRLTQLVNDLLDLSRIQAGKLLYKKEDVDIDLLVEDIVDSAKKNFNTHKIILKGDIGQTTEIDQNRISQVLTNFISNAIKHSPKSSKITIEKGKNGQNAIISVKDSGPGIEKKYHKKIFQRFYQVGNEIERQATGLGIGLYISAEIVKNHNGKIWVESEKGKGSKFCISLPLSNKKFTSNKQFFN